MGKISVTEMLRRVESLTLPVLQEEVRKVVQRSPALIAEKVNEYKRGENPDGSRIGYYRNRGYRNFKIGINPLAKGTVDLIFTGQFTRGLFVESKGRGMFTFDSTDDKTGMLANKYGNDIFGLNQKRWEQQQVLLAPQIVKFINSVIHR